ncbi:ABC transporter substrate-binding protein [Alteribacter populi]|uniref:ABC transporter substrate-binding protein n=1 Tax=Alteribacter populi TaxID=2011011 RepID=UPI000BBB286D|nr:ABC transporter substrate-binding protein [Alteribacter populi]
MGRKFRLMLFLSVMLILTLALAACVGDPDDEPASNESHDDTSDESNETTSEDNKYGGVLTVAMIDSPMRLDPIDYSGVYESHVIRSIADTLVVYSEDLSEIEPSLAESWTISDDMMIYTFDLREDAYFQPGEFQDGRQMTAEDVKFSLERSANDSAMNRLRGIESVEVIDEFSIEIHLTEPNAALMAMLTDAGNSILPKDEVEGHGDDFGVNLVGTGPFSLEEWATDDYIQLTRHDDYWGQTAFIDELIWKSISDRNMMVNALRTGEVDIAIGIDGQNRQIVEEEEEISLLTTPGLSIEYAALNMDSGPTADKKVREALNLATNVDDLIEGVFQWGGAERSYLPLPQDSWGYFEELEVEVPGYDPERAKVLMEESGYPDGFETDIYVIESRSSHAQILQNQLKENLNIDASVNVVEWGTFSETAASGNAPIYIMGWSWYPDPDFFLYQMLHSDQIGSLGNGYGYHNEDVDELLSLAVSETVDQEERTAIYHDILELVVEDMPRIELTNVEITAGVRNNIQGFNVRADNTFIITNDTTNVWKED